MEIHAANQFMWKIAYRLVREYAYTVLHSDSDSIHLMRHKGRSSQYVQLRLCDFLWGATVHNYLEETAARLEGIRQQIGVRTVKGFVVFIMRQPFLGAAEETVHKQPGIDELGISLSPAAYVPEERQWVTGGQYTSAESAILERLFTETTVSETDPPAPFWANEIEQWEIRKQREIEAVFFLRKAKGNLRLPHSYRNGVYPHGIERRQSEYGCAYFFRRQIQSAHSSGGMVAVYYPYFFAYWFYAYFI